MKDSRKVDEPRGTTNETELDELDSASTEEAVDAEQPFASSEIESEGNGQHELLLTEILAGVQRHEVATAQWFEVVRGDLGVLYEQLDLLVKTVIGEPPPEPPITPAEHAPSTAPVQPAAAPSAAPQAAEPASAGGGGFASRLLAATAGPRDDGGGWESVVFGDDLAADPAIALGRQEVVEGLKQQEPAAMAFAGALLEVRSATDDRVPQLLKDVGEAYYRWQPVDGGGDGLRDALIRWLETKCDAIGAGNRIELVRVGDRYDSTRHNAKARGVEVSQVHGWVVLRDNGKVYTKASVAVR